MKNDELLEEVLEEMATIGEYKGYVYRLYGDDGNIPHFHILKDNKTIQCVRIDKAEYFTHSGKYTYELNSEEIKALIKFLNSRYPVTNWVYVVNQWNLENKNYQISDDLDMPDYTKLKFDK